MSTQQKIKKIREACIKANPEIVELNFGCEIETKVWSFENPREVICGRIVGKDIGYYCALRKDHITESDIDKIIGRPIRLADVLLAILEFDKKTPLTKTNELLGLICSHWLKETDDNLENKSSQTIDFIHELLCLKNTLK